MRLKGFLVWMVASITLLGTGIYVFVDLYRWEWIRATITALFFIAAEIGLVAWVLTRRIAALEERLDDDRQRSITSHLRAAGRRPSQAFDWLSPSRPRVFVPILMAAGIVLSGLAWLVERIARATAGSSTDQRVAANLARLGPPRNGFLDRGDDPLALLQRSSR